MAFDLLAVDGEDRRNRPLLERKRRLKAIMPRIDSLHEVRDLLGHANVSQTDTYLGAKIDGLRTKMDRFDAHRGNLSQTPPAIEHRPLSHGGAEKQRKDQLH